MTMERLQNNEERKRRALEISIHVGLVALLGAACLAILAPFLPLITWGVIIAIALYPAYRRLLSSVGSREKLAAVLCTLLLLGIFLIPVALFAKTLVEGAQN